MKQTKTYCDICKEEIKSGYGTDTGTLQLKGRATRLSTEYSVYNFQDICNRCTVKLFTVINKVIKEVK